MTTNGFTLKHAVELAQSLTLHAEQTLTRRTQVETLAALVHNTKVRDTLIPAAPDKTVNLLWRAVANAPHATVDATCNALCLAALAAETSDDGLEWLTRSLETNAHHRLTQILFSVANAGFPFERLRASAYEGFKEAIRQFNEDTYEADVPFVWPDMAACLD